MERYQHAFMKSEQDAGFALGWQRRPDLPQAVAKRPAHRQSDRPAELHLGDVASKDALIIARLLSQPFSYRFAPRG
jgi:hypothetical protein